MIIPPPLTPKKTKTKTNTKTKQRNAKENKTKKQQKSKTWINFEHVNNCKIYLTIIADGIILLKDVMWFFIIQGDGYKVWFHCQIGSWN